MKLNIKVKVEFSLSVNIPREDLHAGEKTLADSLKLQVENRFKAILKEAKKKKIKYSLNDPIIVTEDPTSEKFVN